jgi:putative ABC transport system permease protein
MVWKTPIAWLQLTHERIRLAVAVSGIVFADVLMFMQLGFQDSLYDVNTILHQSLQADLILISPQTLAINYIESFPKRRQYQALNIDGVESVRSIYIEKQTWQNLESRQNYPILMLAFNPIEASIDLPGVKQHLDQLKQPDTVLFDQASRPEYGAAAIHQLMMTEERVTTEVNRQEVEVSGTFLMGPSFSADANLITSDLTFLKLVPQRDPEQIDMTLIKLRSDVDPQRMAAILEAHLPDDISILTKQEFVDLEKSYWARSTPIGFIFSLGVGMGFIVGAVIVYQVLYTEISDHLSEYATLKAIGYSQQYLLGIIFQEALILAFVSYLPGFLITVGLYHLTKTATFLPIVMTVGRATLVMFLTVAMCAVSGTIAIRKLKAADPADIF